MVKVAEALGLYRVPLQVRDTEAGKVVAVQAPCCELPALRVHRSDEEIGELVREFGIKIAYMLNASTPLSEADNFALDAVVAASMIRRKNHKAHMILPPSIKFGVGKTDNLFGEIDPGIFFAGRLWVPPSSHELASPDDPRAITFRYKMMLPGHRDWTRRRVYYSKW